MLFWKYEAFFLIMYTVNIIDIIIMCYNVFVARYIWNITKANSAEIKELISGFHLLLDAYYNL